MIFKSCSHYPALELFRETPCRNIQPPQRHKDLRGTHQPPTPFLLSLSTDTIKGPFYHLCRNISKREVVAEIVRKWGWITMGSGVCVF